MERLQKLLSSAGIASRRHAEELIEKGRVTVDGVPAKLGDRADPGSDIRVDGKRLELPQAHTTFLLYKPRGIVSSAHDELGRETVLDHMPQTPALHNVGRLDLDSEGLLLLTTDGGLTEKLTHPRYAHDKEYRVWTRRDLSDKDVQALERGVPLEDGFTLPARVERAPGGLYITLKEGQNRQIRKMLEAVGNRVSRLVRVRQSALFLGDLEPGEYRTLTEDDLERLRHPERVSPRQLERERDEMYARWDAEDARG